WWYNKINTKGWKFHPFTFFQKLSRTTITENRKWFPTDICSEKHWVQLTIQMPVSLAVITI
ncbi:MAG: hypothetical protein ABIS01_02540, partial [Ferruginibacter sp.]